MKVYLNLLFYVSVCVHMYGLIQFGPKNGLITCVLYLDGAQK